MDASENRWTPRALADDDPACIRTPEELISMIESVGFLPLFSNSIPGFSVEEHTAASGWFSGDPERDPWLWREKLASDGRVVYGKFFSGNAGFVSAGWFADFANVRRDGYDFDALWDDEKASRKQKKIMDLFEEEDTELFSFEIRQKAGFGKEGEAGFESTLTSLQMMTYLCPVQFRQRKSKAGKEYGWNIAVFCKPEHFLGRDAVTGSYRDDPEVSLKRMQDHLRKAFPGITDEQCRKLLIGEKPKDESQKKKVPYPENILNILALNSLNLQIKDWAALFRGMKIDEANPTDDQLAGLEYALSMLYKKSRKVLSLRYEEYKTFKEIGPVIAKSPATAGSIHKKAMGKLRDPSMAGWIIDGYEGHLEQIRRYTEAVVSEALEENSGFDRKIFEQPIEALKAGKVLPGAIITKLRSAGIHTTGNLYAIMRLPEWYRLIPGIGNESVQKIEQVFRGY